MTIHPTGAFEALIPEDVRENVRQHRINWEARYHPLDDLRVTTPVLEYVQSKQTREHLASMDPERRAQLERDWAEGARNPHGEPISDALRARAAAEWENSK